jgi:hypothetical protein
MWESTQIEYVLSWKIRQILNQYKETQTWKKRSKMGE